MASQVAQWSKALHCIASCAARDSGFDSRACCNRLRPGDTFGLASSGLGEGLAGRDVLFSSRTSDSCGGPGAVHADTVARCTVFSQTLPG